MVLVRPGPKLVQLGLQVGGMAEASGLTTL